MIRNLWSIYWVPRSAQVLVYMLQSVEYRAGPYLRWYWQTQRFDQVMHRRELNSTRVARLLSWALQVGMIWQLLVGLWLVIMGALESSSEQIYFGLAVLVAYPVVWAHLVVIPLWLGRILIIEPRQLWQIRQSEVIFAKHPAIKIAVAGSYGKTSMKELLLTVLSEGKKVAATPANKNVAYSHAQFARRLTGDEDILIIEYGEGKPGDVAGFARTTHPTHGIITGLAPAHLDRYKTLQAAGRDIFSLAKYLGGKNVYVNAESADAADFIKDDYQTYSSRGALGWRTSNIELEPSGTKFVLKKGKREIALSSGLLGKHQIGPLSLAAALGLELGLTEEQVMSGVAKTQPFEHRMQPYQLAGAWIINDTYNGNLEGIRAGTALLLALPARRKLYITPGLVDQGSNSPAIHREMGRLIASAKPDAVILMRNSAQKSIEKGLKEAGYKGEVRVEADPLAFYTSLDHFVAAGDVVVMQNDWTDNYK